MEAKRLFCPEAFQIVCLRSREQWLEGHCLRSRIHKPYCGSLIDIYGGPYLQRQQTILETQRNVLETQQNVFETQHNIFETKQNIIETQHKIIKTQHKVIETQISMQNWCDYTTHIPIISQPLTRYALNLIPLFVFAGCGSEELWSSAEIVRNMDVFFIKCLNCSEELEETYQFCSRCGAAVLLGYFTPFEAGPCSGNVYNNCLLSRALIGSFLSSIRVPVRVVQKVDNAFHRINHYPADSVFYFVNTYPLDSDLSGG